MTKRVLDIYEAGVTMVLGQEKYECPCVIHSSRT